MPNQATSIDADGQDDRQAILNDAYNALSQTHTPKGRLGIIKIFSTRLADYCDGANRIEDFDQLSEMAVEEFDLDRDDVKDAIKIGERKSDDRVAKAQKTVRRANGHAKGRGGMDHGDKDQVQSLAPPDAPRAGWRKKHRFPLAT